MNDQKTTMQKSETEINVYRKVYRACACDINALIEAAADCTPSLERLLSEDILVTLSLYRYRSTVYLYLETTDPALDAETLFESFSHWLSACPGNEGPRYWIELMNIHYWHNPGSLEHWKRPGPVEKRMGKLNRLKSEMVSSYIYYHYLAQISGSNDQNKYVCAYLDENYIFMYVEMPKIVEPTAPWPTAPGIETPAGPDWHVLMEQHFIRIPELPQRPDVHWYEMEPILSL